VKIPALDTEYGQLLQKVQPKVIHTKKEHARQMQEIKRLMLKADKRTPAESALLGALATFVHEYELKKRPLENHTPAETLEFMMEQHNKKSVDLPIPHTRVSEILSGKRSISKAQAIALESFFMSLPFSFLDCSLFLLSSRFSLTTGETRETIAERLVSANDSRTEMAGDPVGRTPGVA
jgi:HTH-type transcriptional regulator/antitoxin HigA